MDLPGTYSLTANSLEEKVSREFILNERPDVLVVVLDASQLERTMYLLTEVLPLGVPVVAALNMMDVAEREGCCLDVKALEKSAGVPVVSMVASKKQGMNELVHEAGRAAISQRKPVLKIPENTGIEKKEFQQVKTLIAGTLPKAYPEKWAAVKLLEGDADMASLVRSRLKPDAWKKLKVMLERNKDGMLAAAGARYTWIADVVRHGVSRKAGKAHQARRGKFDKIATHPVWGVPLAIVFVLLAFMAAMMAALPLMSVVMKGTPWLIQLARGGLAGLPPWIVSMIADGLLPGVGMAFAFLGFLFAMFLVIGFVEDVGYLARVAFISDRFMGRIGLHGKSFLPMLTSLGCNVAGVLGSRVVDSSKQRMMTLVMAPIVPCAAVWGVVAFFGTLFFGPNTPIIILALLVTLAFWLALTGLLFKRFMVKDDAGGLIMELPPYHKPNWKTIISFTWGHTKSFLVRGVTLIAGASIFIWALSYFPHGNIETSLLGIAGRAIEPFGMLMGLDWRLLVALIASMASKEAALATLGVLYGLSSGAGTSSLTGLIMGAGTIEHTAVAKAVFTAVSPASALAFMFAAFFSVPCLGTLGAIFSETRSWKWTLGATAYYTFAALFAGFLAYRVGLIIL